MRVRMLTEAEGGQDAKVEMLKRCEEVIQQQQARPFKKKKIKKNYRKSLACCLQEHVSLPLRKKRGKKNDTCSLLNLHAN